MERAMVWQDNWTPIFVFQNSFFKLEIAYSGWFLAFVAVEQGSLHFNGALLNLKNPFHISWPPSWFQTQQLHCIPEYGFGTHNRFPLPGKDLSLETQVIWTTESRDC